MRSLYSGESLVAVILVTIVLGGGAAALLGRAIARARPPRQVALAAIPLGAAARFIHFALFQAVLLSPLSYACDTVFFCIVGLIAWRATRASQMVRQYPWLYRSVGPLSLRKT
jgi:uncharacterized protein DUF6867